MKLVSAALAVLSCGAFQPALSARGGARSVAAPRRLAKPSRGLRAAEGEAVPAEVAELPPGTTASGLRFVDEVVGDGEMAVEGTVACVMYTGRLASTGRVFDSSVGKGAFKFVVGDEKVIPGWEEGISTMRVGGKRLLKIPSNLGYGSYGSEPTIPANADLEFDCELVAVQSGPVAVALANAGIGLNLRSGFLLALILSIILPEVFPGLFK